MIKKSLFCFLLFAVIDTSVKAQLAHTNWKGMIKIDDNVNVAFIFTKDTLTVKNLDENTIIETMIYTVKDSIVTLKKVSGQSDCDNSTIGLYNFKVEKDALFFNPVQDVCEDRSSVLDGLRLQKVGS